MFHLFILDYCFYCVFVYVILLILYCVKHLVTSVLKGAIEMKFIIAYIFVFECVHVCVLLTATLTGGGP